MKVKKIALRIFWATLICITIANITNIHNTYAQEISVSRYRG